MKTALFLSDFKNDSYSWRNMKQCKKYKWEIIITRSPATYRYLSEYAFWHSSVHMHVCTDSLFINETRLYLLLCDLFLCSQRFRDVFSVAVTLSTCHAFEYGATLYCYASTEQSHVDEHLNHLQYLHDTQFYGRHDFHRYFGVCMFY